jgi:YidC/Oxa1 family membrane protein insertase
MNDIRRTLLWVVFGMSLLLIYDAWQKHTGHGSLFGGPAPRPVAAAGASPATPASGAVPAPAAVPAVAGATPTAPGLPAAAPTPTGERVTITTDVVKAVFESQGGNLVYLELLGYKDGVDPKRNVVLLDQSPKRLYVAQTGLVAATPGVALPNHFTQMTVVPGERTLAAGAKTLTLRFESPLIDGHKLAKTYTFTRGEYTVGVKHEFSNQGTAPVAPQLYLQLVRDGNKPG